MKKMLMAKMQIILVIVVLLFFVNANAASDTTVQTKDANVLVKLNLLQGYSDGSLKLQNKINRSEFITLVVRMMGYDKNTDTSDVNLKFKDITPKQWAYNYIKIAVKRGVVAGYPDNTIAPNNYVTYSEALTVLIRVLGYQNNLTGKWPDNVINESTQLGLVKDLSVPQNKQLTRGEMSVLVYNSLTVNFK